MFAEVKQESNLGCRPEGPRVLPSRPTAAVQNISRPRPWPDRVTCSRNSGQWIRQSAMHHFSWKSSYGVGSKGLFGGNVILRCLSKYWKHIALSVKLSPRSQSETRLKSHLWKLLIIHRGHSIRWGVKWETILIARQFGLPFSRSWNILKLTFTKLIRKQLESSMKAA